MKSVMMMMMIIIIIIIGTVQHKTSKAEMAN
jgi:hypothetical protein